MSENNAIYLDSVASASDVKFSVEDGFANPSSTHDAGREAFAVLEDARETISNLIGAKRPSEVYFTSGATEANNIAILGIARAVKHSSVLNKRNKILVCSIEHESALLPAKHLEEEGFVVELLPVDQYGFIKFHKFIELCDDSTALVICHNANTEVGTIQNINKLCDVAHENGAYFHCDCVGTFGWIPVDVLDLDVDSASFSGHKLGAPKGIGALYLKSGTSCEPIMFGGNQEKGLVPGTQSVSLASAFAKAAKHSVENIVNTHEQFKDCCTYLISEIAKIDGVRLTIDASENKYGFLWNILHLTFPNKSNKDLILQYGKRGIIVSGGPACSSTNDEPSHVLQAIGINEKEIDSGIRLSFSENTTKQDLEKFIEATKDILA